MELIRRNARDHHDRRRPGARRRAARGLSVAPRAAVRFPRPLLATAALTASSLAIGTWVSRRRARRRQHVLSESHSLVECEALHAARRQDRHQRSDVDHRARSGATDVHRRVRSDVPGSRRGDAALRPRADRRAGAQASRSAARSAAARSSRCRSATVASTIRASNAR